MENYISFSLAKKIVRNLKLKTKEDYWTWWDKYKEQNEKIGLPRHPEIVYQKPLKGKNNKK